MTSIFVAKLDFGVTSDQLRQTFQQFGTVLKATVATDRETGKSRGFGFVEMANREEAMRAISELDGFMINGRPIAVKEAEQRQDSRPPRDNSGADNRNRDFQRRNDQNQRPEPRTPEYKKPASEDSSFTPAPAIDPFKTEIRKKEKEKERKKTDWDSEGRNRKPKMNAYKKSGKNNKFFDDDEEDDWDDMPSHTYDSEDDLEYDEEDNDEWED